MIFLVGILELLIFVVFDVYSHVRRFVGIKFEFSTAIASRLVDSILFFDDGVWFSFSLFLHCRDVVCTSCVGMHFWDRFRDHARVSHFIRWQRSIDVRVSHRRLRFGSSFVI